MQTPEPASSQGWSHRVNSPHRLHFPPYRDWTLPEVGENARDGELQNLKTKRMRQSPKQTRTDGPWQTSLPFFLPRLNDTPHSSHLPRSIHSVSVALKMWTLGQQYQHHLGTLEDRFQGAPAQTYWIRNSHRCPAMCIMIGHPSDSDPHLSLRTSVYVFSEN